MDSITNHEYSITYWIGDAKVHRDTGSLLSALNSQPFYIFDNSIFTKVEIKYQDKTVLITKESSVPTILVA